MQESAQSVVRVGQEIKKGATPGTKRVRASAKIREPTPPAKLSLGRRRSKRGAVAAAVT